MPLSQSQQNYNKNQFHILLNNSSEEAFNVLQSLWDPVHAACDVEEIILNTDKDSKLQANMERLLDLLLKKNAREGECNTEEAFQQSLKEWAAAYKRADLAAGEASRLRHAAQAKGITRGLREDRRLLPRVWCEDLDLKECLKGIMVTPETIRSAGTYILPPVDLSDPRLLKSQIETVKNNPALVGPVKLLTPVSYGGHWRLAKVEINAERQISSASLWDSFGNHFLNRHPAYVNMQTMLNQIQPGLVLHTEPSKAIQTNGWSCGDYVTQNALQEKYAEIAVLSPSLVAVRDAGNPEGLRKAMVERIVENNPALRGIVAEEKTEVVVQTPVTKKAEAAASASASAQPQPTKEVEQVQKLRKTVLSSHSSIEQELNKAKPREEAQKELTEKDSVYTVTDESDLKKDKVIIVSKQEQIDLDEELARRLDAEEKGIPYSGKKGK